MGSQPSFNQAVDNFLEPLQNISVSPCKYLWLDHQVDSKDNLKYLKYLQNYLYIHTFQTINSLESAIKTMDTQSNINIISSASFPQYVYKRLNDNQRINKIHLFCRSAQKAQQLIDKYSKIVSSYYEVFSLKNGLLEHQKDIKSKCYCLTANNISQIVHNHINFNFLSSQPQDLAVSRNNFISLFSSKYGQGKLFLQNYSDDIWWSKNDKQRVQIIINEVFKNNNFYIFLQRILHSTKNPKQLAYLQYPIYQIHKGLKILSIQSKIINEVYCVCDISENQYKEIKNNISNFITFNSFLKAYTNLKQAEQMHSSQSTSYLLTIKIRDNQSIIQNINTGYAINPKFHRYQANFIFNFPNYFRIINYIDQKRQIRLQYGGYSLQNLKNDEKNLRILFHSKNLNRIITQGYDSKLLALDQAAFYEKSIQIKKQKLQKSASSNQKLILSIADNYTNIGNKRQAQNYCNLIKPDSKQYLRALNKKYELYSDCFAHADKEGWVKKQTILDQIYKQLRKQKIIRNTQYYIGNINLIKRKIQDQNLDFDLISQKINKLKKSLLTDSYLCYHHEFILLLLQNVQAHCCFKFNKITSAIPIWSKILPLFQIIGGIPEKQMLTIKRNIQAINRESLQGSNISISVSQSSNSQSQYQKIIISQWDCNDSTGKNKTRSKVKYQQSQISNSLINIVTHSSITSLSHHQYDLH